MMRMKWIIVAVVLTLLLSACSSDPRPVPVVAAGSYNQYNQGIIKGTFYRVKRGDTLYSIAWRTGVEVKTLARINHIRSPYLIYAGQKLRLRWHSSTRSVKRNTSHHHSSKRVRIKKRDSDRKKHESHLVSRKTKDYVVNSPSRKKLVRNTSNRIRRWVWPTKGRLISGFSSEVTGNKGIDIAGHRNQPVYAAAAGRVVYAGNALRGYGNLIIIKHNDDYLSAYAHNSRILVKEHQTVKAGQHIADMGETGTISVRLHFEIRYKGKSVDPLKFLPKR
ncbi:MAG: Murein hydrolase activator NlpD [Candidatus Celerinatantimonas neptuna]|nr:MAG: Murein hydrolase activator NlpD [Candidatus Celerinatantimonas neptuna]